MTVEELLASRDVYFIPKGADCLVSCINPEHSDRNPSMRVDRITGIFQCFSCGYKGNIFTHFGEKANHLQVRRELFKKRIKEKRSESIGLSFPRNVVPYVGNWRDIKPETYKKFEAFQHHDPDYIGRVVFPVRDISGRIVAFNGRHTTGGTPKYMISPAGAKMPLFPVVEPIQGSVILVEGIFDMINLHDKGLDNAVCTFGTKNINEDKLKMLSIQGVDSIDVFFDGDDAGQDASKVIQEMCERVGLTSRNVCLKDTDPGALPLSTVQKLKSKLYG
ncbi:MAG: toprim domain-containing protein [Gammaproteobacteria bacterium]|nr:toprim domain-containing protein [Gammaproteobacteria bacterium]